MRGGAQRGSWPLSKDRKVSRGMGSEVKIEIPTILIEDTIRAEIARQIPNKEKFIDSVINFAMSQKRDTYNSTPTYFQEAVNKMIRDEATRIFGEWLEQNRDNIKKALIKYLNDNKQKALTGLAEQLANNISTYGISVSLHMRDK